MTEAATEAATRADGAEPILRLRGIGRRFGGLDAVIGVDLSVAPGERRAILGPNGAGKTTLFNVISGDIPPTSGRIELFGADVTWLPARQRAKLGLSRTYYPSEAKHKLKPAHEQLIAAVPAPLSFLRRGNDSVVATSKAKRAALASAISRMRTRRMSAPENVFSAAKAATRPIGSVWTSRMIVAITMRLSFATTQ